jgi:hypothetical protein
MDIIKDRHRPRSTVLASQLPVDRWCHMSGNPAIGDAIFDCPINSI